MQSGIDGMYIRNLTNTTLLSQVISIEINLLFQQFPSLTTKICNGEKKEKQLVKGGNNI